MIRMNLFAFVYINNSEINTLLAGIISCYINSKSFNIYVTVSKGNENYHCDNVIIVNHCNNISRNFI